MTRQDECTAACMESLVDRVRCVEETGLQRVHARQAEGKVRGVQNGTHGPSSKCIKRESESPPEMKQEPEIKQESFTIRGYFGFDEGR